jgi:hypothetical protein
MRQLYRLKLELQYKVSSIDRTPHITESRSIDTEQVKSL